MALALLFVANPGVDLSIRIDDWVWWSNRAKAETLLGNESVRFRTAC